MSFRILNQAPQYLLPDGRVNAGGRLHFYETDLSTPKDTWSDEGLSVLNANPVVMDAAGRTSTDVWGDGEYGVVMTDAAGVTIWTRNNVRADVGAGQDIPALVSGQFLTNDGAVLQWQPVRQVPDPSGSNTYILSTDGENAFWIPQPEVPEPPEPDWDVGENYFKLGARFEQWGTGTAPAAPSLDWTSVNITFPVPFDTAPDTVNITVRAGLTINGTSLVAIAVDNVSGTGCTVSFNNADRHFSGSSKLTNPIPFSWEAKGMRADPP